VFGDAQVSTLNPRFGSGSLLLDGNGDYLTLPADNKFQLGTQDFTVEFWIYPNPGNNNNGIFTFGGTNSGLALALYQGNWFLNQAGGNGVQFSSWTANVWQHVAVTRAGTSLRLFVDGLQMGATQSSSTDFVDNQLKIGYYFSNGFNLDGRLDEFRITKGVARYTSAFTPPTAAFPDS
jgi:hypothetical protein